MLLRSSSTPVLGSLLSSSFSESPNNYHHPHCDVANTTPKNTSTSIYQSCSNSKLSYKQHVSFCNSSPISPLISKTSGSSSLTGFRRALSDGNLEGLLISDSCNNVVDEFGFSNNPSTKFARKRHCSTLEAIPSFSFYNLSSRQEGEFDSDREEQEEETGEEELRKETNNPFDDSLEIMEKVGIKERDSRCINGYTNVGFEEDAEEMYLARGLGVSDAGSVVCNGGSSGGGHGCRSVAFDWSGGGDRHGVGIEEHYKRLLEENPRNPLCLRNYAQFLHQTQKDLKSAEEYYSRAILADPIDGEVVSQYANLVWELYHDKDRATSYFERAIRASAENSHVQAAYASFLWETEDDEHDEEDESCKSQAIGIQTSGNATKF